MMAGADTQTGEAPRGDAVTIGARARGEGGGEGGQGGAGEELFQCRRFL